MLASDVRVRLEGHRLAVKSQITPILIMDPIFNTLYTGTGWTLYKVIGGFRNSYGTG